MKYTIKEFAKEIRKLYPGDYDDLSDEKLVELWLRKYPNDKEKIDFNNGGKNKVQTSKPSTTTSGSSWESLKIVFWIGIIAGGIYLFNVFNHKNYLSNSNSTIIESEQPSANFSEQSNPETEFNNIQINSDISAYIDTNKIVQQYGFNERIKTDIKRILSDPNPDKENKSGTNCGQIERRCKWCSNTFYVNGTYTLLQNEVKSALMPEGLIGMFTAAMSGLLFSDKMKEGICDDCNLYRSGIRYKCDYNNQEFCSEKCKVEYQYNHRN